MENWQTELIVLLLYSNKQFNILDQQFWNLKFKTDVGLKSFPCDKTHLVLHIFRPNIT